MWSPAAVLVCALELLGRDASSFPPIQLVDTAPAGASAQVEAYVLPPGDTIYVLTSTPLFQRVLRSRQRCLEREAVRKLASILVHEEWHVRHGRDERGAYSAQLDTLFRLGMRPGSALHVSVVRSMLAVVNSPPRPAAASLIAARGRSGR